MDRKSGIKNVNTNTSNMLLDRLRQNPLNASMVAAFDFLSTKCVYDIPSKSFRVVLASNKISYERSQTHALDRLVIEYAGTNNNGVVITTDHIDAYKKVIMNTNGEMSVPLQGPMIEWNNNTYLNTFRDNAIINDQDVTDEDVALFDDYIKVLCRGVFGIVDYDMTTSKFIDIVVNKNYVKRDNKKTEPSKEELIDYYFSWVSAIYHTPGINLTTIPCFFGIPGTGKSSLAKLVCKLVGNSDDNINQITTGRFNSMLEGKLIVCYNEVKDVPNFYNDVIKGTLTEEKINIERKGVDAYSVLNICSGMLLSNHLVPFKIDSDDRRLVIISGMSTNDNKMAEVSIQDMNIEFFTSNQDWEDKITNILAKLIRHVEVDIRFINNGTALTTEAKKLLQESYQSPIERFFEDENVNFIKLDSNKTKTQLRRTSIKELEELFKNWMTSEDGLGNVSGNYSKTISSFKNDIKALSLQEKYVQKDKHSVLYFTESFYEEYIKRDGVEEMKSKPSNIAELAQARIAKLNVR